MQLQIGNKFYVNSEITHYYDNPEHILYTITNITDTECTFTWIYNDIPQELTYELKQVEYYFRSKTWHLTLKSIRKNKLIKLS